MFAGKDQMAHENRSWRRSTVEEEFGNPVGGRSVGIDPTRSVLIGDLAPDMPFALDYRDSEESPKCIVSDLQRHHSVDEDS